MQKKRGVSALGNGLIFINTVDCYTLHSYLKQQECRV